MDEKITEAKKLLRENGYAVIKLSKYQIGASKECDEMEGSKDCFGCPCSACVVQ